MRCLQAALQRNGALDKGEVDHLGKFAVKELTTKKLAEDGDWSFNLTEWARMSCAASPGPHYDLLTSMVDRDQKLNPLENCLFPPHLSKAMHEMRNSNSSGVLPETELESCTSMACSQHAQPETVTESSASYSELDHLRKYIDDAMEKAVTRLESRYAKMAAFEETFGAFIKVCSETRQTSSTSAIRTEACSPIPEPGVAPDANREHLAQQESEVLALLNNLQAFERMYGGQGSAGEVAVPPEPESQGGGVMNSAVIDISKPMDKCRSPHITNTPIINDTEEGYVQLRELYEELEKRVSHLSKCVAGVTQETVYSRTSVDMRLDELERAFSI